MFPIVVLFSGRGSNLQALIQRSSSFRIVGSICNRPKAAGVAVSHQHNIPCVVIDHQEFEDRATFETAVSQQIDHWQPELIVLAGFMRILNPTFTRQYLGRMINIHPSLLPKYPGLNTHQRALDNQDQEHGASIHLVTPDLDAGPIIAQTRFKLSSKHNTAQALAEHLLPMEHQLLVSTVELFAQNQLQWSNGSLYNQGQILNEPIEFE